MTVEGTDENGIVISKSYTVVRFGIKQKSKGEPYMQGTPEGEFSDLQWKPDALKGKGGWQIVGPYYIHQGNGNVFNKDVMGNNGCIAICTVLDSKYGAAFKDFQGTLQKFSGTTDFYLMKINLQVVKAETPSIIEE